MLIGALIALCTLLAAYFGMSIYFMSHYYFGSEIDSISVSGKSVEDAKELMTVNLNSYTLTLKERESKNEQIKASEVGLSYSSEEEFQKFKDSQNPFKWILTYFTKETSKAAIGISYDENLLKERIDKLSCLDSSNVVEPQNPSLQYTANGYEIVDGVLGNKIDKDKLYPKVADAILKKEDAVDLEAIDCYIKPQYTSTSKEVIAAKDELNKYSASKITYTFGDKNETLDGSTINKWLMVEKDFTVTFDESKAKDYISTLAKTYNTTGKVRSLVTTTGKTINLGGGDYGWSINKAKETEALVAAIKEGQTISKEPAYSQTALSHSNNDIGNTYVEVDMTKQHLWFYKNGSLIVQGDVVTGNISAGHRTPGGIYKLKYKQKNAVLRGPGYAAPVTYWMPFNGGIGIHDASWRRVFGGSIYKTGGSHGCVNAPFSVAQAIFSNIEVGTPVICYY